MIDPAQIPDEAVEAAERTYRTVPLWTSHADSIRAAIAAALNAWPNAKTLRDDGRRQTYIVPAIILPLPQQARDE